MQAISFTSLNKIPNAGAERALGRSSVSSTRNVRSLREKPRRSETDDSEWRPPSYREHQDFSAWVDAHERHLAVRIAQEEFPPPVSYAALR